MRAISVRTRKRLRDLLHGTNRQWFLLCGDGHRSKPGQTPSGIRRSWWIETGFLFVIAGKANLIEYPCAYRPTAHDCMDYIPDGLCAFIHLGDEWLPYLIGEGHAGSSYDLDITDEGYHKSCTRATDHDTVPVPLSASRTEQSNDGITIPILQGDSISHHITGNIGSGVGLADL